MKFAIRVDDIGWKTGGVKDEGMRLAQKFHASLNGLPYLAGVIPKCVDLAGLTWLQAKPQGMTVALHGYNHFRSQGNVASEFHDFDFEECRKRVCHGRRRLDGVEISHMVLPFNAYTPPLGEACYLEGIRWIWGGAGHDRTTPSSWPTPPQPYSIGRVVFVPSWLPLYGAVLWQMGADDRALAGVLPGLLDLPGKALITLHITWEASKGDAFAGVKWLAERIADRTIAPDEYLK